MPLQRFARVLAVSILCLGAFLFTRAAMAGINWISVWLAPRTPVVMNIGETRPYTVMGLNGANIEAELTHSQYLKIASSDPDVIEIDPKQSAFIAKKAGQVEIRIAFSEAKAVIKAVVRESNAQ